MDFIPGYRLIHIEELEDEYKAFMRMMELEHATQIEAAVPLLAGSASNYICYVKKQDGTEAVFLYSSLGYSR